MLRRWLVFLLVAETIAYVAIATVLFTRGWGGWATLALIFLVALVWHGSHACSSFLVCAALRWRDGRHDRRAWSALWGEFTVRLTSFNISQPFEQWVMPDEPAVMATQDPGVGAGVPMLLVHGYFSNRGMWVQFRQHMLASMAEKKVDIGSIYSVTLETPFDSIDVLAEQLHDRIEFICASTGHNQVVLVCHSMGGLVARAYRIKYGAARLARLITLGTPHHGTQIASLGVGTSSKQMGWHSPWLTALAATEQGTMGPNTPPTTSIYTVNDDLVYPPESSCLVWADNIAVDGVGHIGLLFSDKVVKLVVQAIKTNVQHPRGVQD